MGNYNQEKVTGWQRSNKVIIDNKYQAIPTIQFQEEMIIELDGTLINRKDMGFLTSSLRDPNVAFSLLNPEDDSVIGSGTFGQAYVLLYSIYRFLADRRDLCNDKMEILDLAKAEYDVALDLSIGADLTYTQALAALTLNPTDGVLDAACSIALNEKISAADLAESKKFIMDAAQDAYDAVTCIP